MTPSLCSCTPSPFYKRAYSERRRKKKEMIYREANSFVSEKSLFHKGVKSILKEFSPCKSIYSPSKRSVMTQVNLYRRTFQMLIPLLHYLTFTFSS